MSKANDDSELRTRADFDAWVERDTPELDRQPRRLESSDERAHIEWCLTVLLTGRTPVWDYPRGKATVTGPEYIAAMRWLRERWPYLRTPLSRRALRAYNSPQGNGFRQLSHARAELASSLASWPEKGRPPQHLLGNPRVIVPQPNGRTWISWASDEIAYAAAFIAALKESHRPQESFRFTIPEELQAEIGREWLEHPPCVPVEALPLILQWPMWMRARLANEYLDALIPGFAGKKIERRAIKRFVATLDKRSSKAGESRTRNVLNPLGEAELVPERRSSKSDNPRVPQQPLRSRAPSREWDDPTFEAVAARLDGAREVETIMAALPRRGAEWLSRYLDAKDRGVTDQEFAREEGLEYPALRKRLERVRDRISREVSQNRQRVEVLGGRSEKEVKAMQIAEQNEVLRDVRDRLDALLVGLEDTVSVLVWKFPSHEDQILDKAGEIFAALSDTSNPDIEEAA